MSNIKLRNLEAFMQNNKENIILQYDEDNNFKECVLKHTFDTDEPWRGNINKEKLKELFNQFVDMVENKR